jgi:ATP-dependent DNA helicase RecG
LPSSEIAPLACWGIPQAPAGRLKIEGLARWEEGGKLVDFVIPLKLETLLEGRIVEQDRVEYKRGWNPSDTIHTICAFANDFTNTNGGYIVIGIDEQDGHPLLPPVGVGADVLDNIQKELFQYCNLIEPRYIPQLEIVTFQGRYVVYLWCSAGDDEPYMAPSLWKLEFT